VSVKKDRVNIAVAREVAEELGNVAESLGMTQFALANDILTVGLEAVKAGYKVSQIRELLQFYRLMVELEIVPIPGRLLDSIVAEHYRKDKEGALKVWCEAGRMLGSYLRATFGGLEEVSQLVPYLAKIVPAKRFELKASKGEAVLEIVGVGYSLEAVEVNAAAAKCLFESYGYEVVEQVTAPGILVVKARERGAR